MFEPKKNHPGWLLSLYPYIFFLRYDRNMLLNALIGRASFHWRYSWESESQENESLEYPDFDYIPGRFIMPEDLRDKR